MTPKLQDSLLPPKAGHSREDGTTDSATTSQSSRTYLGLGIDEEDDNAGLRENRESHPFLQVVQGRFTPRPSVVNLTSRGSKASFAPSMSPNLTSRPSMASLKETLSRVNLELYPEKGSYVAYSMGQSMASIPTIAPKVYIITQVSLPTSSDIFLLIMSFNKPVFLDHIVG